MEETTEPAVNPLNWLELWRIALLHPTLRAYATIVNHPKASTGWGVIWAAFAGLVVWLGGPQRTVWWGLVADNFGLQRASNFMVIGTVVFPVLWVVALLVSAAIAHGLARQFKSAGAYHRLVFCWGTIQLPFLVISILGYYLFPFIYSVLRTVSRGEVNFSVMGIVSLLALFTFAAGIVYLFYAEVVGLSAVETFTIGKGFGMLVLSAIVLVVFSYSVSFGFQALVMKFSGQ